MRVPSTAAMAACGGETRRQLLQRGGGDGGRNTDNINDRTDTIYSQVLSILFEPITSLKKSLGKSHASCNKKYSRETQIIVLYLFLIRH